MKDTIYAPVSTYRVQFSKGYTFKDLESRLDYLHELGIRTIYASPIFEAVPGSSHGYDVTNPNRINPEIGSMDDFLSLRRKAATLSMGWIQDIVPNHMAFSTTNPWLRDVLENGQKSDYKDFFDIDWDHPHPELKGKLLLPSFGKNVDDLIRDKEIQIVQREHSLVLSYFNNHFPLSPETFPFLLEHFRNSGEAGKSMEEKFSKLPNDINAIWLGETFGEKKMTQLLKMINEEPEILRQVIRLQNYLPAYWKVTNHRINYRRFFTINDMIALKMESQAVFDAYHRLIANFCKKNYFQGIRVDHVDGLFKPAEYLMRLRKLIGDDKYIIVEKILEKDEDIPISWPVQGTTGYDFSTYVNNLLTNNKNEKHFTRIYDQWDPDRPSFSDLSYTMKSFIINERMRGDLHNLAHKALPIFKTYDESSDLDTVSGTIAEFLVSCPVYKVYRPTIKWESNSREFLKEIFEKANGARPDLMPSLGILETLFLDEENEIRIYLLFAVHAIFRSLDGQGPGRYCVLQLFEISGTQ